MSETLNLKLRVWRQAGPNDIGGFVEYELTVTNAGPDDATGVSLTDNNVNSTGLPTDTILSNCPSTSR